MQIFKYSFILFYITTLFVPEYTSAQTNGKVIKVVDGDTFIMQDSTGAYQKINLTGVDCPEKMQHFGHSARDYVRKIILNKNVLVINHNVENNGTIYSYVYIDGVSLNEMLLREGWAWHNYRFNNNQSWAILEKMARNKDLGIWKIGDLNIAPWIWRANLK